MKKKFLLLFITLFCAAAFANDLPKIAVYVTGTVPEGEKNALGTRMLASLVNSGRYQGIERSGAFLAEIMREQQTQRSGAVDDNQISQLGKQFGVKYVCIAAITPAFGSYQVSARIVDVETAAVVFIGEATSPLKTMRELTYVADKVVSIMFGEAAGRGVGLSMGFGGAYAGDFGGGIAWGSSGKITMPHTGLGAYLFLDAVYAEVSISAFSGSGKWESGNVKPAAGGALPDVSRSAIKAGLFGKYPIAVVPSQKIKAFPLAGVDYEAVLSGKFVLANGEEAVHLHDRDLSALWFKGGAGVDVDIATGAYLRLELLYGLRTPNKIEQDAVDMSVTPGAETLRGHGLTLRCGAAIRF